MAPPIRLIALDIDGTLLNSRFEVSETNRSVLHRAHDAGIHIALVTGRRHTFALPIAQSLGFDVLLISSNGAVTRSSSGERFHRDLLPASTCRDLCTYMDEFREEIVITFDREDRGALVLENKMRVAGSIGRWIEKNDPWILEVKPIESSLPTDPELAPIQAMYCGSMQRMQSAWERLMDNGASSLDGRIHVTKTVYPERDLFIIDILNGGCSKGYAIERFCTSRGIARDQVIAIGDNFNDLEMLRFSGYPFVMANATEEIKQMGFPQTLHMDEDGVAAAIQSVLR